MSAASGSSAKRAKLSTKDEPAISHQKLFGVTVVGSLMTDLVAYCEKLPAPGQTVHGREFATGFGGKGANQAVQALYLGSKVAFVGRLGQDSYGQAYKEHFNKLGVDGRHLELLAGASSGVAPIVVDAQGANQIVVVGGANNLLTPGDVDRARSTIEESRVLVTQLEVPVETTVHAMRVALAAGDVVTICNPAPAAAGLPDELYWLADIIAPNETEIELMTGVHVETTGGGTALLKSAKQAATALIERGATHVLITLGAAGAYLLSRGQPNGYHVAASAAVRPSSVVDTTGAGDSYLGSLAHFLAEAHAAGKPLSAPSIIAAMRKAAVVAGKSVQAKGTQASYPKYDEIKEQLK